MDSSTLGDRFREWGRLLATPEGWAGTFGVALLLLTRLDVGDGSRPAAFARWLWGLFPQEDPLRYRLHVWLLWSVVCLLPGPLLLLRLRRWPPAGWGLQVGLWRFWLPWIGCAYGFMGMVILLFARENPSLRAYYPFFRHAAPTYHPATEGWGFFVGYQILYGLYFFAWEFFFRGFLLFLLAERWGEGAIALQVIPFALMHLGKPLPEVFGAIPAGWFLGWLAYRGRSFLPCFVLHWMVALTMDLAALGSGG